MTQWVKVFVTKMTTWVQSWKSHRVKNWLLQVVLWCGFVVDICMPMHTHTLNKCKKQNTNQTNKQKAKNTLRHGEQRHLLHQKQEETNMAFRTIFNMKHWEEGGWSQLVWLTTYNTSGQVSKQTKVATAFIKTLEIFTPVVGVNRRPWGLGIQLCGRVWWSLQSVPSAGGKEEIGASNTSHVLCYLGDWENFYPKA